LPVRDRIKNVNNEGTLTPQDYSIQEAAYYLKQRLQGASDTASLDAQVLLSHIFQKPRAWVLAHPEVSLSSRQSSELVEYACRLEGGEALPYVLGHWEFYGLRFNVTPDTLIPRPETELLIDEARCWLVTNPGRRKAADIGTGTGCIAITLAKLIPDLRVLAVDVSGEALETATANAEMHGVKSRVQFIRSDLLSPVNGEFDLLSANLPYIPQEKLATLEVSSREPALALDGGIDGLALIGRLFEQAPDRLAEGGLLLVEIEASQGNEVRRLAHTHFPLASVQVLKDLVGHDRLVRVEQV
jgi:release factor glutamine methyltransferase